MFRTVSRVVRDTGLIAVGVLVAATAPWIVDAAGGPQAGPAPALREISGIPTNRADAVEALGMACATSDQYVNMPGMTLVFTLGGSQRRPVIAQFSGTFGGFGDEDYMVVRVRVDGLVQPGTGAGVTVNDPSGRQRTGGFTFYTAGLTPGNHRVTLQFAATTGIGAPYRTCLGERTLIVLHA
jgi:hypothetical protein